MIFCKAPAAASRNLLILVLEQFCKGGDSSLRLGADIPEGYSSGPPNVLVLKQFGEGWDGGPGLPQTPEGCSANVCVSVLKGSGENWDGCRTDFPEGGGGRKLNLPVGVPKQFG